MTQREEFLDWWNKFISKFWGEVPEWAEFWADKGWQACAERKDKRIDELEAEIKKLRGGDYYDVTGRNRGCP